MGFFFGSICAPDRKPMKISEKISVFLSVVMTILDMDSHLGRYVYFYYLFILVSLSVY